MNLGPIGSVLVGVGAITAFVLLVIFVLVPVFRGIGWAIGGTFQGIGWLIMHLFEFIGGMIGDAIRLIGAVLAMVVLGLMVPLNVIIGRWSAAGHFASGVKRECAVGTMCLYRIALRRPLKLLWLHGLLEGLEERVPEAMAGAPGADKPSRATGQFDGYTIVGSLRSGGSGAKLYIAEPLDWKKGAGGRSMPKQVVIKCFALSEGSGLPQIVRESRALECARELGHVLDHGMDESRFWYVMPYHAGDHLGIVTRQLHAESGGNGLGGRELAAVTGYTRDLLATLACYHKGGLWHKDVKPENVIVHDNRAHLVDLGLVTSLRSAMTLTTHGTEYFRDPEMVRQALRGVKVHQINGVKFDIYAVGAVLYFMLENTFPAHGGLSSFAQRSPEALRWIVKRAMTEYQRRYETADEVLSDLVFAMSSADPYAVKVADLPSVRGTSVDPSFIAAATPPVADALFASQSPAPQKEQAAEVRGWGLHAGLGANGPFAKLGSFGPQKNDPSKPSRTKFRVTNWWTGAYEVDPSAPVESDAQRIMREEADAYRNDARLIRNHAAAGGYSPRRAAREQIKAARSRAEQIRRRAQHRRAHTMHRRNGPTAAVAVVSLLVALGLVGGGLMMVARGSGRGGDVSVAAAIREMLPDYPRVANDHQPRLMMAIDPALPRTRDVISELKDIMEDKGDNGYYVMLDEPAAAAIVPSVESWNVDNNKTADAEIENWLAAQNLYAIVWVTGEVDEDGDADVSSTLIRSTRKGAEGRTSLIHSQSGATTTVSNVPSSVSAPSIANGEGRKLLIINDHPTKLDPLVEVRVQRITAEYREAAWDIVDPADLSDAEAAIRKLLPIGEWPIGFTAPEMLNTVFKEACLDGVLWIGAGPGEGDPHERVIVKRIMKTE